MGKPVLQIENLSFGYSAKPLFQNLSFQVQKNQICHIVGNNGAGKSTLLALIARILSPQHGSITLDEEHGNRHPIEYLSAEKNGLLQAQTIRDNLEFWRNLSGLASDEALYQATLKDWQLDTASYDNSLAVHKFSTGMKRRLALARVCYAQRPIWLLDEPTFGLDRNGQDCLYSAVKRHVQQNGCVVLVTHQAQWLKDLPLNEVQL